MNPQGLPGQVPRLVSRSLACLRIELHAKRVASSSKLRQEFDRRLGENAAAVATLRNHARVWAQCGGEDPGALAEPSDGDLEDAQQCAATLRQRMDERGNEAHDIEFRTFGNEIVKAVDSISRVTWEAIHAEKFWITPRGLYGNPGYLKYI